MLQDKCIKSLFFHDLTALRSAYNRLPFLHRAP